MKKRLLSLLLAVAVVMTYAASAFAATPADVKGTNYQSAVEELAALGVLNGYPDGTFKPTNTITRAELAKVVVVASGNESAATLMAKVKPTFKDVKANQWFTGFVNVAATKGLIKGDAGTKNFRPNDKIKFEEVVAVLIRALGYQDSKLNGAWPYNVILKAQDIGLLDGVDITAGTLATRGVVALLTSNTVNGGTVVYDKDGVEIGTGHKLVEKLGLTTGAIVMQPSLNGDNKIELNTGAVKVASNFVVTGGKVLADLLGHKVSVLKNKVGEVVAVTDAQAAGDIVAVENDGTADTVAPDATLTFKGNKSYKVRATGSDVSVADSAYGFYRNFKAATGQIAGTEKATLLLDKNGKVQFINVINWQENKLFVSLEAKTTAHPARVNLGIAGVFNVDDNAAVKLDGKAASLADLKENDVVRYVVQDGTNTVIFLEATRSTVSGKIEKVRTDADGFTYYTVAGKEYKDVRAEYISSASALKLGDEYAYFLNKDAQVAGVKTINNATSSVYAVTTYFDDTAAGVVVDGVVKPNYAIIKAFSVKDNKEITVYLPETYNSTDGGVKGTISNKMVIKLEYKDGKVFSAESVLGNVAAGGAVTDVTSSSISTAANISPSIAAATYLVNSNTIYINASQSSGNIYSLTTADKVTKGDEVAFVSAVGIYADVVVLVKDSETSDKAPAAYGTYKSLYTAQTSTTTNYYVVLNVNGADKTVQVTKPVYDSAVSATYAAYNVVGLTDVDAPYNVYDHFTTVGTASTVGSLSVDLVNRTFTVNGSSYIVTSNTTVYVADKDNNVSIGSINDMKLVQADPTFGSSVQVSVTGTGSSIGAYTEAGAVVVKKY